MTSDEIAELRRVVAVRPLEWRRAKAFGATLKLIAVDCFGNEFSRLDLSGQSDEEIAQFKEIEQSRCDRTILSALTLAPAAGRAVLACFPPGPPDVGEERPRRILFYPPGGRPAEVINVYTADQVTRLCEQVKREAYAECAKYARCQYDERSRMKSANIDWDDGYRDATKEVALAIEALAEKKP